MCKIEGGKEKCYKCCLNGIREILVFTSYPQFLLKKNGIIVSLGTNQHGILNLSLFPP